MLAKRMVSIALCLLTGVSSLLNVNASETDVKPARASKPEQSVKAEAVNETDEESVFHIEFFDSSGDGTWFDYVVGDEVVNPQSGLSWNSSTRTLRMNGFWQTSYQLSIYSENWSGEYVTLELAGENALCNIQSAEPLRISGSGTLSAGFIEVDDFEMLSGTLNLQSEYLRAYFIDYDSVVNYGPALFSPYGDDTNLYSFLGGTVNITGDYNIGIDQYSGNINIMDSKIFIDLPKNGITGLACGHDTEEEFVYGGSLYVENSDIFIRTNRNGSFMLLCYEFNPAANLKYYAGKNTITKSVAKNRFLLSSDQYTYVPALTRTTYDTNGENVLRITPETLFVDAADETKYFYEPVYWAFNHDPQVTTGTSSTTFSPDENVTRGQFATFLYRAAGEPEVSGEMPFTDVKEGKFYYNAVMWAVQNEITTGTSPTTFAPNETLTRGQIVTFLYRFDGSPEVSAESPFTDVKAGAFYETPVIWAYHSGVTTGTSATKFSPNNTCTRGQAVTFLYRVAK